MILIVLVICLRRFSGTTKSVPMDILYKDNFFLSVNKPPGILVHQTRIDKHDKRNLVMEISQALNLEVKVIHRLDKPVTGVMLFALNNEAAIKPSKP